MFKIYKVNIYQIIFYYFIIFIFFIIGILVLFRIFNGPDKEPKWFMLIWLIGVFIIIYFYIQLPYKVILKENKIEFKSIFFKKYLLLNDLVSIKSSLGMQLISFNFNKKKIIMLNSINNLHELITNIKKINKKLFTVGC